MYVSLIMIKCKGLQLKYSRGEFLTLPKFYSKQTQFLRSRSRKCTYTVFSNEIQSHSKNKYRKEYKFFIHDILFEGFCTDPEFYSRLKLHFPFTI